MGITYRHGKKLPKVMCHRCGGNQKGTIQREGPRWVISLSCGHVKTAGWTKPTDVLTKEGLANKGMPDDPREAIKKQKEDTKAWEDLEKMNWELMKHQSSSNRTSF